MLYLACCDHCESVICIEFSLQKKRLGLKLKKNCDAYQRSGNFFNGLSLVNRHHVVVDPDAGLEVDGLHPERVQLVERVTPVNQVTLQLRLELLGLK